MIITKWKQIINGIFPFKDNHKINNDLKKKMNTIEIDDCLKKEYCLLCDAPIETRDIDVDSIQKIYDSEISRKSILEDKAKTNVIGIVTIHSRPKPVKWKTKEIIFCLKANQRLSGRCDLSGC